MYHSTLQCELLTEEQTADLPSGMTLCNQTKWYERSGGTCCFHLYCFLLVIIMAVPVQQTCQGPASYQTVQCHFPADSSHTGSTGYNDGTHATVNGMCFRVEFTASDSWGSQDDEGAWVGLLGMLTEGAVDLMVCHPTLTADRRAAALFLHPTLHSWYSS
jgi:hypothetical protein